MSHDAAPPGYRSWLHYYIEQVRNKVSKEELEDLEARLRVEDEARQIMGQVDSNDESWPSIEDTKKVLTFLKTWRPE